MSATSPAEGLVHIWGTVTVSVAGTLQATVTNSTSNDNCTIPAGALMKLARITDERPPGVGVHPDMAAAVPPRPLHAVRSRAGLPAG